MACNCGGCSKTATGATNVDTSVTPSSPAKDTCSGCWAQCGGGCSGSSAQVSTGDKSGYDDRYGSGDCWCGADCAGCGGCSGDCSGCSGECSGCSGDCGSSCSGACSNGCSSCAGDCKGYCKGTCNDGCLGSCSTACSGECSHLCNIGCQSNAALEAYQHLIKYLNSSTKEFTYDEHLIEDKIVLDWLDAIDMHHLFKMIQEEGRRRVLKKTGYFSGNDEHEPTEAQTLTKDEEALIGIRDEKGYLVDDDHHIKRLVNMYADNTGKSLSLSTGGTSVSEGKLVQKSIGTQLIESALARYQEKIAVRTISEDAGKQTLEDGK